MEDVRISDVYTVQLNREESPDSILVDDTKFKIHYSVVYACALLCIPVQGAPLPEVDLMRWEVWSLGECQISSALALPAEVRGQLRRKVT